MADAVQSSDKASKVVDFFVFKEAQDTLKKLSSMMEDQTQTLKNNRSLRFTQIDIEAERKAGRLAPDEIYVPQHLIDSNIRREQAIYISYITSAPRAVIMTNISTVGMPSDLIEKDFTTRTRYEGWQFPWFRGVDGMQQNGYAIMELVADQTKPGHVMLQEVAFGDFGYSLDSKQLQSCEVVSRKYHYTKTQLLALTNPDTFAFDKAEVAKVVTYKNEEAASYKEQSLFCVEKVMFRKAGIVHVAWANSQLCDNWIRKPRPLTLGELAMNPLTGAWEPIKETNYPYFFVPYTISENTTLKESVGRVYLDQDYQESVSSLMSSFVTAHRRAAYLMFSKDTEYDPNNDAVTQSNVVCKSGAVINSKVKQFQLTPPDPSMLSAIQALVGANMQENSQINYAANNRQDSRKTATEIQAAASTAQQLSTVQIALFSSAFKSIYSKFFDVVRSRILAGMIEVSPDLKALYAQKYVIKPAGDIDVVERQQKIQAMQTAWPVIQATPIAQKFLLKMIQLQFPEDAAEYAAGFQEDNSKTVALHSCASVLEALVADPSALSPHEQANLPQIQQLLQQIQQILQPQQQQASPQQQSSSTQQNL